MDNRHAKKSKLSIMIKAPLKLKLFPQSEKYAIKKIYSDKLEKLFSHPPSNFGYKSDIEGIMNDLALRKDQLFRMAINSLNRSTRTKPEIRIIASYLFLMQDFIKLLKAKSPEQKENLLLKDLLTLAENVEYEKYQNNTVLMRYGEKGNNAFIILDGKVDVLIENYFNKNVGDKTYLYYLANLIKYHEFGLVNSIVNENFKKFPMEIIDDITIKNPGNDNVKSTKKIDNNINNNQKVEKINYHTLEINDKNNDFPLKKSMRHSVALNSKTIDIRFSFKNDINRKFQRTNTFKGKPAEDMKTKKKQGVFKLNNINEEFKENSNIPQYSAKELLNMFGLKLIDKKYNRQLNHINTDEYIKRLNILDNIKNDQLFLRLKKDKEPKEPKKSKQKKHKKLLINKSNQNRKDISKSGSKEGKIEDSKVNNSISIENSSENEENPDSLSSSKEKSEYINIMNEKFLENMKLCTYSKIICLDRGSLFGEMALNEPNSLRKATIITNTDCHFGILNKKTFNNSIKMGAQKHMKETLHFFKEIPIFSGIPESVFYNKYYTNLSKSTIVKGKNVINQGEKPEHITLLQTGSYGLTTHMSLYDLTRLILHYADILINQNINQDRNKNDKNANNKNTKDKNIKKDVSKKELKKKEENKKDLDNLNNIQKLLSEESELLTDSIVFKKYYYSLQYIRITEIYSPEVILNDEFIDENGLYAFTIEAKAPENIIYTLNNKFLMDFNEKNISIQKNKEKFLKQKMDLMIKRLLIIRNSLINTFFDSKEKKEVGEAVIKELEDMILLNLKKKRVLNKKEEIILNTNENEKKERNNNSLLLRNKNPNSEIIYRNGIDIAKDSPRPNKQNNKLKPYKSHEKFEYEFKAKAFKKNKTEIKKKLKPLLRVSLKTAIKFTNKKESKSKSKKRRSTILKSKEELPLFSLGNKNLLESDNNLSRNSQSKIKFKPISFSYGIKNSRNNKLMLLKTRKILMNNLIWENITTNVKSPIKLNLETNNLSNNIIYNSERKNSEQNYYQTYYGRNYFYHNKNIPKIKKNIFLSTNNNRYKNTSSSFSHDENYYHDMKIEPQNKLYYISPTQNSVQKQKINNNSFSKENSYSKTEIKTIHSVQNLKKNEALLKMKLKKLITPDEIQMMRMNRRLNYFMDRNKYNKMKGEKFETHRKHYYKKTIMNRMNFFYGKIEK